MPKGKAPKNKNPNNRDYVGPFDGDSATWMTRKRSYRDGIDNWIAPQDSNPNEGFEYKSGFQSKESRSSKIKSSQVTPGRWKRK